MCLCVCMYICIYVYQSFREREFFLAFTWCILCSIYMYGAQPARCGKHSQPASQPATRPASTFCRDAVCNCSLQATREGESEGDYVISPQRSKAWEMSVPSELAMKNSPSSFPDGAFLFVV